jgi:uncharacterized glyoxalase superfamily protein PhnB
MESAVRVTGSAVCLTVEDVPASTAFFAAHLGYEQQQGADGFASMSRPDAAPDVVFLRRGLQVLPPDFRDQHSAGVIVALVVDDLDGEHDRLRREGVQITLPLVEQEWGERLFQVKDPNGVVVELLEWVSGQQHSVLGDERG